MQLDATKISNNPWLGYKNSLFEEYNKKTMGGLELQELFEIFENF